MSGSRILLCLACLSWLPGCPGDDGGEESTSQSTVSNTTSPGTEGDTTGDGSETTAPETTGDTTSGPTTAPMDTSDTGDGSTGPVNACDPVIPGEFNACVDENGGIDNTQCNWMGLPDAVGFIGCLNSGEMDGANVCFISDCVDDCDCFAPPADGTAVVTCGPIVEGGGNGCYLDCSAGQTCPTGMECIGQACFWPPA